jgi:ornithine cyclodeaminase
MAVFSPFGLGVLDIAVAKLVRDYGLQAGQGTVINSFLPDPWVESK